MKILLLTLIFGLFFFYEANASYDGDGRPGCKTEEEMNIKVFRNTWDSTRYWVCENMNEPAVQVTCPPETGFMQSRKDCVSWEEWQWEEIVPPISEPSE